MNSKTKKSKLEREKYLLDALRKCGKALLEAKYYIEFTGVEDDGSDLCPMAKTTLKEIQSAITEARDTIIFLK